MRVRDVNFMPLVSVMNSCSICKANSRVGARTRVWNGSSFKQRIDERNEEGAGLAGTGGGNAHHVFQRNDVLERFFLNLGGELPAGHLQCGLELGVDVPIFVFRFGYVGDVYHRDGLVNHQFGVDGFVDVAGPAAVAFSAAAAATTIASSARGFR